jgi:hypothetical protein
LEIKESNSPGSWPHRQQSGFLYLTMAGIFKMFAEGIVRMMLASMPESLRTIYRL